MAGGARTAGEADPSGTPVLSFGFVKDHDVSFIIFRVCLSSDSVFDQCLVC